MSWGVCILLDAHNIPSVSYFGTNDIVPEKEEFKSIFGWWLKLRKSRQYPSISEVDFKDLKGWHSYLVLTKVRKDLQDLEFRIIGEGAYGLFGNEIKPGLRCSELTTNDEKLRQEHLDMILHEKPIHYFEGPMQQAERQHIHVKSLGLPFSDEKGRLSHFLTFYSPMQ